MKGNVVGKVTEGKGKRMTARNDTEEHVVKHLGVERCGIPKEKNRV